MIEHPMTWALAGRMAVWTILIVLAMVGLASLVGRFLGWLGARYSKVEVTSGFVWIETTEELEREAVTPITENQWQQNARKAEALGFLDDDYPRAS